MSVPTAYYLTLTPRDAATGAPITVRLAGGGRGGYKQFGSTEWKAGLNRPPAIAERIGFDGEGFEEGAAALALSLTWRGRKADVAARAAYYWRDAPFTLHSGPQDGDDSAMELLLSGRVSDIGRDASSIIFPLADISVDYAKPIIKATYAGTGGIEGDPEIKGKPKRRAWGVVYNVTAESLIKANNIHVVTDPAHPILAFDQVYDRGNAASALTLVLWAGSIAATLAALIAAVAPAGGAAVAPSIGCLKWWHGNPGKLTCDIRGTIGGGYVDKPVDIAIRVLESVAAVSVDAANVNQHRIDRNYVFGWLVSDTSSTAASEVQSMMSGISSWFAMRPDGVVQFGIYAWGASVMTLTSARPEIVRQHGPVDKINLGWRRNQTIMARGDIAEVVFAADVSGLGALATKSTADFVADVSGIKPEANATSGSNLIYNANVETGDTSGWSLSENQGGVALTVTNIARSGQFSFAIIKPDHITGFTGAASSRAISVQPGQKFIVNTSVLGSHNTAAGFILRLQESSLPPLSGTVDGNNRTRLTDLIGNGPVTQGWVDYTNLVYMVPANVYFVSLAVYNWVGGPAQLLFEAAMARQTDAVLGQNLLTQGGAIVNDSMALNALQQWGQVNARPANLSLLSGSEAILNGTITIGANGKLLNAGGGEVTIAGLGYIGALNATFGANWASNVSNLPANLSLLSGSEAILNGTITIGANGKLLNAGGGEVTIAGLGYIGQLNATFGANWTTNLSNLPPNLSLLSGSEAILNALITPASIGFNGALAQLDPAAAATLAAAGGGGMTVGLNSIITRRLTAGQSATFNAAISVNAGGNSGNLSVAIQVSPSGTNSFATIQTSASVSVGPGEPGFTDIGGVIYTNNSGITQSFDFRAVAVRAPATAGGTVITNQSYLNG